MYKKIIIFSLMSLLLVGNVFASTSTYGLKATADKAELTSLSISSKDPIKLASDIIAAALSFLGIVFFLLIFYAGIEWMTAMGATDKVDKAKEMLEGAVIGLLIIIASYALANFIFTNLGLGT